MKKNRKIIWNFQHAEFSARDFFQVFQIPILNYLIYLKLKNCDPGKNRSRRHPGQPLLRVYIRSNYLGIHYLRTTEVTNERACNK